MDLKIKTRCEQIFYKAQFIKDLSVELRSIEKGLACTELKVADKHLQQHGFVHAGVLATMADHTAGVAATSCIAEDQMVLTVEFKVNFMRPAATKKVICESKVLRAGKNLAFADSDVYAVDDAGNRKLVSKALVTLSVVKEHSLN